MNNPRPGRVGTQASPALRARPRRCCREEAEITVNEDGDSDDIDATVTAPGIAALCGRFVPARCKVPRDGPVAKCLLRQFEANP